MTLHGAPPRLVRLVQRLTRVVPRGWRGRMRATMFAWLDLAWTLPSGIEVRIQSYADWVVFNEIFVGGDYDAAIQAAVRLAPPERPMRVLDLGANVGLFTARAVDALFRHDADRAVAVTLVEANPRLTAPLERFCSSFRTPRRTLRVIQGLAGKPSGEAILYASASCLSDSITPAPHTTPIEAHYVDLRPWLLEGVDLLKCDIEGSEQDLLEAYADLLPRVRVAVFEFHSARVDRARCVEILARAGFEERRITDRPGYPVSWFERVATPATPSTAARIS